eukprot:s5971_g1.t2
MTCLTVLGSFVVSGDLSIEGCYLGRENSLEDALEKMRRLVPDASDENNEVSDDEWDDESFLEIPTQLNGNFKYFAGGAIDSYELTLMQGTLSIRNCSRGRGSGGALRVKGEMAQFAGAVVIEQCRAREHGGAISAGNFSQLDGKLLIKNCSADMSGRAIRSLHFLQLEGDMMIRNCSAGFGGAIGATQLDQENGRLSVEDCVASEGGAISTARFHLRGRGVLHIERCQATKRDVYGGGAILSWRHFLQSSGLISIRNCSAENKGGGIYAEGKFEQSGGRMMIQNCRAFRGGGIYSLDLMRQGGDLGLHSCSADAGGAIYLEKGLLQTEAGRVIFENCSAREGGALYRSPHRSFVYDLSFQGQVNFTNCSADGKGGGLYAGTKGRLMASELFFQDCTAKTEGAAVYSEGFTTLRDVTLNRCESGVSGALTVYGDLNVTNLKVSDAQDLKGQSILSGGAARVHSLICSGTGQQLCGVGATKASAVVDLVCPTGTERRQVSGNGTVWCHSCISGHVRLLDGINPQCQRCPKQSIDCLPTRLTMPPGMTVDPSNFSIELYCPNPAACRGGSLLAPASGTNISLEETYHAMCEEGYVGTDCSKCTESHGKADHNPLTCVKCPASSTFAAMRSIFFYTAKDSFLFASAAASSLSASKDKKHSAIFLNQLMAFATVANIVVTGVMQTRLFAEFHADTQRILTSAGLLANVAQAQGDGTASKDCLLKTFGFPGTLVYSHLVSTAMPVILMSLLAAWKGPKLSLRTNVFLPGFTAAFGKYLIAFRSKPQHEGGSLETPFMPLLPGGGILISLAIVCCFAIGILGWRHVIRGAEKPFPPYVLYLTGSYKPECHEWEIERLVRKMLLSVLTCAIPVSYSPALQMEAVSVVLIVSMNLHTYYMPYKVLAWNFIEIGLLTTALLLTGLTTTLIATDLHFSQSRSTASFLIFLVIFLVAAICGTMIVLVLWNIYREWKSKGEAGEAAQPEPLDLESKDRADSKEE